MNIQEATKKALAEDKCITEEKLQELASEIASGDLTTNEARKELSLNPINCGDQLYTIERRVNEQNLTAKFEIKNLDEYLELLQQFKITLKALKKFKFDCVCTSTSKSMHEDVKEFTDYLNSFSWKGE